MAYTQDASTSEGLLRTYIFDKTTTAAPVLGEDYQFADAELTSALDQNSDDIWAAAADLCRALAAKYAAEAIELGLGKRDIYINKTKRSQFYLSLASQYSNASLGGGASEYIDSANYNVNYAGQDYSDYSGDYA